MTRRRPPRKDPAPAVVEVPSVAPPPRRPLLHRFVRTVHRLGRRHPFAVAGALALLHITMALLTFEPRPHTGGDNAAYISLAQSLLERGTYTEVWDPAEPPHTKYPPGLPVILAIAMAVGLKPWVQLKLVILAFSAAAVACSFLWMRARRQPVLGIVAAGLLAIAPGVLREGRWILSDVPFWALTMVALWSFERLRPGDWKRFAVAVAATLLAYFTRSAGLPLVLAAFAWLAGRRQWPQLAAFTAVLGIPIALWTLRSRAAADSSYVSEFWLVNPYLPALGRIGPLDLVQRVFDNVAKYAGIHLPVLLTNTVGFLLVVVSVVILLLAVAGWVRRIPRPRLAEIFLPLYLGLILVWPAVWSGERFLLPLLPLILYYAGDALVALVRSVAPRGAWVTGAVAAALVVIISIPALVAGVQVGRECTARYLAGEEYPCLGNPVWDDFFWLSEISPEMLPEDAVVLTRKPRLFYQLSGLRSRNYPLSDDPAELAAAASSAGAGYVILDRVDSVSMIYLAPILQSWPDAFCIMYMTPATSTVLLALRPERLVGPPRAVPSETQTYEVCGPERWRDEATFRLYNLQ